MVSRVCFGVWLAHMYNERSGRIKGNKQACLFFICREVCGN